MEETFGHYAVIQRCQWHKRENVVSYLKEDQQEPVRKALQKAYSEADYTTAKKELEKIAAQLKPVNQKACNSLLEGMEETLSMQRLGLHDVLAKSFTTTNCIESLNSQIDKYVRKVKNWMNSDQRNRWVIMALKEAESKMNKVYGFKYLNRLQEAIEKEINRKFSKTHSFNGGYPH